MNSPMQATVIGTRGSAIKAGQVESVTIERADNGFSVRIRTKQPSLKKGEMRDYEAGQEMEVYNSLDDMIARIKAAFEQKPDKKAAKE